MKIFNLLHKLLFCMTFVCVCTLSAFADVSCPAGYVAVNEDAVYVSTSGSCPAGHTQLGGEYGGDSIINCIDGLANGDAICTFFDIACQSGKHFDGTSFQTCQPGTYCDGTGTATPGTPGCSMSCPDNSTSEFGASYCTCKTGYNYNGGTTTTTNACVHNIYTVTYDCNGGSGNATNTVTYGGTFFSNTGVCTRNGYTLAGYTIDGANVDDEFIWNYTSDKTLVAVWTPNKYSCSEGYYLDGTGCVKCPAGNYCPGVKDVAYDGKIYGLTPCPTAYPSSAPGATSDNHCYTACTMSNTDFANSVSVTGKDYYGDGYDTCTVATCNAHYHRRPDLTEDQVITLFAQMNGMNPDEITDQDREMILSEMEYAFNNWDAFFGSLDATYQRQITTLIDSAQQHNRMSATNAMWPFVELYRDLNEIVEGNIETHSYYYEKKTNGDEWCGSTFVDSTDCDVVAQQHPDVFAFRQTAKPGDWFEAIPTYGITITGKSKCDYNYDLPCRGTYTSINGVVRPEIWEDNSDMVYEEGSGYCESECNGAGLFGLFGDAIFCAAYFAGEIVPDDANKADEDCSEYADLWTTDSGAYISYVCDADTVDIPAGQYLPAGTMTPIECPAGSYCSGQDDAIYDATKDQGIDPCSTAYPSSAPGATSDNHCYTACTMSNTDFANSVSVTGKDYYGDGYDTCTVATCNAHYHRRPDLTDDQVITLFAQMNGMNPDEITDQDREMILSEMEYAFNNWDAFFGSLDATYQQQITTLIDSVQQHNHMPTTNAMLPFLELYRDWNAVNESTGENSMPVHGLMYGKYYDGTEECAIVNTITTFFFFVPTSDEAIDCDVAASQNAEFAVFRQMAKPGDWFFTLPAYGITTTGKSKCDYDYECSPCRAAYTSINGIAQPEEWGSGSDMCWTENPKVCETRCVSEALTWAPLLGIGPVCAAYFAGDFVPDDANEAEQLCAEYADLWGGTDSGAYISYVCDADTVDVPAGQYLPAGTMTPIECPANSYCKGQDDAIYDATKDQGIAPCPIGTVSAPGATSQDQCTSSVKLHIGDDVVMNLVSARPTTSPVMVFQVGDTPYYAPMSATETPINSDTNAKYRVLYNETEYWVHDYTAQ